MQDRLLLALGGATGSGKTALAVALAKKHRELVLLSADSRQVYKKLDIGTAKIGQAGTDDSLTGQDEPVWRSEGVSQFLIDIAEPNASFSLADYQKEANRLIHAAWKQGKIPILVGGTGLYLQAVIEGYILEGGVDQALRKELESLPIETLQQRLTEMEQSVSPEDWPNKRRLVRAIERAKSGKEAVGVKKEPLTEHADVFILEKPWEEQRHHAVAMVEDRLKEGLVEETKSLLDDGVDKLWLESMGLSYRLVIQLLNNRLTKSELRDEMIFEFRQLMRRQRTWFKKMPGAQHLSSGEIMGEVARCLAA